MAAYASTVTLDLDRAYKLHKGIGVISGICDITNYNQIGAEITDITNYFSSILRVIADGIRDNGYIIRWNTTDSCFHAFYSFYDTAGSETAGANITLCKTSTGGPTEVAGTGTAYGQAATEVADDVDVGEVNFIAIGIR